jgi:hypothetical protein
METKKKTAGMNGQGPSDLIVFALNFIWTICNENTEPQPHSISHPISITIQKTTFSTCDLKTAYI